VWVGRQRYTPYGQVRYQWGSLPTTYNFTGQRLDGDTGLLYYGARYYDPALMRFVQADTLVPEPGNPQSLNRYAYVLNNPLKYTDPTSLFSEEEIMKYFGVSRWEDVLALFEKGGIYEGRWGWLETLRQAEAGTQVTVLDKLKVEGCNEWTGECRASATSLFQGTFFIGDDGKIYLKQDSGEVVPAEAIARLGTVYSLDNPNANPMFRSALIEASSKTYHIKVNWNKALDLLRLDELAVFTYATLATGATTITLVEAGIELCTTPIGCIGATFAFGGAYATGYATYVLWQNVTWPAWKRYFEESFQVTP